MSRCAAIVAMTKHTLVSAVVLIAAVAAAEPSQLLNGPEPGRVSPNRMDRLNSDVQEATHSDFEVRQAATVSLPHGGESQAYVSAEGRFTVTFPSGCSSLDLRANYDKAATEVPVRILAVECRVAGVYVEARLGAARGLSGSAAGELVVAEVRRFIDAHKATPLQKRFLHEEYGERGAVDWFEIEARPKSSKGELKVRGYLYGEDIYFLIADSTTSNAWAEPQFVRFFADFRPWAAASADR